MQARLDTGVSSGSAYEARYAALYYQALAAAPFAVVGTTLKETKSRTELLSTATTKGYIADEVQPKIAKDGAIGDKGADDILWARSFRTIEEPLKPLSVAALARLIAANRIDKPDIWAAREVSLASNAHAAPVTVAIWDSGVDTRLFPGRLYAAKDHAPGNPNGLSFDVESRPASGVLRPLSDAEAAAYPAMLTDLGAFEDLRAAIDSPAADALKAKMSAMPPDRTGAFRRQLNFFGDYGHGTQVADIAARGNPFIRLAVIRDTDDYRQVPPPPTDQTVARRVALYRTVSAWLKANRIRVVNMSWGDYPENYETDLEKNGIGKDVADRQAMARRFFDRARAGFVALLADNPHTLFVASAGNTDSDNGFDQSYPSALTAPNLIVVSAADQAGDETNFTSGGRNVTVSANGYRVLSVVPGGTRQASSGTSEAAPGVANLAAKLIALTPSLSPAQTIALIKLGATISSDGRRRNIDPKASVKALQEGKY